MNIIEIKHIIATNKLEQPLKLVVYAQKSMTIIINVSIQFSPDNSSCPCSSGYGTQKGFRTRGNPTHLLIAR